MFNSRFDSGNFARIEQTGRTSFVVWAGGDCHGTQHENNFRSWFHFSVKAYPGFELSLTVRGISVTPKLYKEGMRPVFRNGNNIIESLQSYGVLHLGEKYIDDKTQERKRYITPCCFDFYHMFW